MSVSGVQFGAQAPAAKRTRSKKAAKETSAAQAPEAEKAGVGKVQAGVVGALVGAVLGFMNGNGFFGKIGKTILGLLAGTALGPIILHFAKEVENKQDPHDCAPNCCTGTKTT